MPDQVPSRSTSRPRTTRNSRGLRHSNTDRESSVESVGSATSVDSTAPSRRTRKLRSRRASSTTPNAANIDTGSTSSTSNLDTSASEPTTTNPPFTSRATALPTLAPISEEEPQAASPRALPSVAPVADAPTELASPLEAPSTQGPEEADQHTEVASTTEEPPAQGHEETNGDTEFANTTEQPSAQGHEETNGVTEFANTAEQLSAQGLEEADEHTEVADSAEEPSAQDPEATNGDIEFANAAEEPAAQDPEEAPSTEALEEADEEDSSVHETSLFAGRRREEGHKFGYELYTAIKAELFTRSCVCPLPTIHGTKEEAEAGTGVFRFYQVGTHPDNIRVFMRKDDNLWHCQCQSQYLSYTDRPLLRKRKAEDTELDLEAQNSGKDTQAGITTVRAIDEQNGPESKRQESIRSMWGSITGGIKNMSASVKGWLSQLHARLTAVPSEAIETRKYDEAGRNLVVKRFKRQYCLPLGPDSAPKEEAQFEQLPYFEWASDATANIGETAIRSIKDALWRHVVTISARAIAFDTSVDALRARHKNDEDGIDVDLSIGIFNLMTKHFDEVTKENFKEAASMHRQGAGLAVEYINTVYLRPEVLPILRKDFAKPPKRLDYFGNFEFKMQTRQAGDFLTWLLTQKALFNISGDHQVAIAKIIVDMDAVHKQEVPPSLVQFPGYNADLMPGSFPLEDSILEVIPTEDFIIEPVYECKHPDSRPPTSSSSSSAKPEEPKTPSQPKGILKKEPKKWPENPVSPGPGDGSPSSRARRLQFKNPEAFFTPPRNSPKQRAIGKARFRLPYKTTDLGREYLMSLYPSMLEGAYHGTKYGEFLQEARRELYSQPGFKAPPPPPKPWDVYKKDEEARRKAREAMTPEERRRQMDLLVRDLELNPDGEVVRRELLVPEAELIIATRRLEDLELSRQVRQEVEAAAERERQKMVELLAEEKRLRLEEEKRKEEEERLRREEEERRQREEELRAEQEVQRIREAEERATRMRLRAPSRPMIGPITEEWQTKVMGIASAGPNVELAKTLEGQILTRRDFEEKLLPATAWLNDNVITGSILYVGEYVNGKAGATAQDPRCATFTSYFWPRLESAGPAQCGRLMRRAGVRKDNFLNIDSILIPICSGNHWTLAVVLPSRRRVLHMDSLRGGHGNPDVTRRILEWVKVTLDDQFVEGEWEVVDLDGPLQRNGWDCGVFTITNGLCLALGLDPNESYTAQQLTLQRHRLAAVLLNGGFKGDFDLEGI